MTGRLPMIAWICLSALACSPNMTDQPSYQAQEAPRLHSPSGSVPRSSRVHSIMRPLASDHAGEPRFDAARLFEINCAHCHGSAGRGDGPVAPYLSQPSADLRAPSVQAKSEAALYAVVTSGLGAMPPFQGELAADERWALVAWITSLNGQTSERSLRGAPEAAQQGQLLYATYCLACHGPAGRGNGPSSAAMNPKPADLAADRPQRSDSFEAIVRTISTGIEGTAMPGFGYLPERDRQALGRYVLSLREPRQK